MKVQRPVTATPAPSSESNSEQDSVGETSDRRPSLIAEFLSFLVHNKTWWLLPIVVVLALLGVLVVLGASPLGPWMYTLF